jgi:hypothetical protein
MPLAVQLQRKALPSNFSGTLNLLSYQRFGKWVGCPPQEGNLACAPSFDSASAFVAASFSWAPLTLWHSHSWLCSLLLTLKIALQHDSHALRLPYRITFPSATTAMYLPS